MKRTLMFLNVKIRVHAHIVHLICSIQELLIKYACQEIKVK